MRERKLLTMINAETGEVIENVTKVETESKEKANKIFKEMSLEKQEINNLLGNFIFKRETKQTQKIDNSLSNQDLSKLMYIITFIDYNNKIVFDEGKSMKKSDIKEMIGISNRIFYEWYNKMVRVKVIIEESDGIYINEKYSFKGTVKNRKNFNRVFINAIREIYEANSSIKDNAMLGMIMRLIPYTNNTTNTICYNPFETDHTKIRYLTVEDIVSAVGGYGGKNKYTLKKMLGQFRLKNGQPIVMFIEDSGIKKTFIVVNPMITQSGRLEHMKSLVELFKSVGESYNLLHKSIENSDKS